ncbi:TrpH protein [Legionella birminghamensis]|uniref:TrpH protein n=1 Tax=Legionella birminghamensis TaxID=28083 RepID=A0A378I9F9_9GAMM|nr:PHP domain-containing protein [Legionella birminghamensis]KTC74878.1 TrpH protein [Legionella birminghamensis]STX31779.1 TrpH protein [Legionella birminghamensis]
MIDLHCHSTFSDGLHNPEELLNKALHAELKLMALTDHDTIDGSLALVEMASQHAIRIIPGIEISTRWKKYDIHILGYQLDLRSEHLDALIREQEANRQHRAVQIAEKLSQLGIEDVFSKVSAITGHGRIGRPHFAQLLINEGLVTDKQAAFSRFLGMRKPAYVPTPWVSIEHAVQTIIHAGGQAVLAHPMKYKLTRSKLHELISLFKEAGGEGMEVVSGEGMTREWQELAGLCLRYELLASSGSDFHGDGISRISLGRQARLPEHCSPIWEQWLE